MDPYDGNLLMSTMPIVGTLAAASTVALTWVLLNDLSARKRLGIGASIIILMFVFVFFRSPPINKQYNHLGKFDMVSPAEGKILGIDKIRVRGYQDEFQRVSIFLSVMDKHFQCAPCDAMIESLIYKEGEFHAAHLLEKSQYNERMVMGMHALDRPDLRFYVILIAGLIARRIHVFDEYNRLPATIERGKKMSLIRFGSRVDVLIPKNYQIQVKTGQRVKVGETVLARYS